MEKSNVIQQMMLKEHTESWIREQIQDVLNFMEDLECIMYRVHANLFQVTCQPWFSVKLNRTEIINFFQLIMFTLYM